MSLQREFALMLVGLVIALAAIYLADRISRWARVAVIHPEPITLKTLAAPMPEGAVLLRDVTQPDQVKLVPLGERP